MAGKVFLIVTGVLLCLASISSAENAKKNLIPGKPGKSPNYWCTWAAQNYMYGQGAEKLDPILFKVEAIGKYHADYLNEETLFGPRGWIVNFFPKVRCDLYVILDDGWDTPLTNDPGYKNYFMLDPKKFPSFRGTIPENLKLLNKRVIDNGWRGVGIWMLANEAAYDSARKKTFKSDLEYKNLFWGERMEWCKKAGIEYWKIDGVYDDPVYIRMSGFVMEKYPGLIIENQVQPKDNPFNGWPGTERIEQNFIDTAAGRIQYGEVLRLYDISPQLGIPSTLERLSAVLQAVKTKPKTEGYLNCDDEVYVAAALGGTMGILRNPMTGLRPGADPDLYMNGPRLQKKRMDEVVRAVRWQRIAPAYGPRGEKVCLDSRVLFDSWKYSPGEFWTSAEDWKNYPNYSADKVVTQGAPARVTRGLELPEVTGTEDPPYIAASLNPSGAVSIAALGRLSPEKGYYCPEADVALKARNARIFGIFGYFRSVSLEFDKPLGKVKVWAQDLAGDEAEDITGKVKTTNTGIIIPGEIIKKIGLSAASKGDLSDPGMVLKIE
jgi:hypothetical protein